MLNNKESHLLCRLTCDPKKKKAKKKKKEKKRYST